MARKQASQTRQIALRNNFPLAAVAEDPSGDVHFWIEKYFEFEVTTAASSRRVQRRDLDLFAGFLEGEVGSISHWSPRLSSAFREALTREVSPEGKRVRSDRTVNRIIAHVKTFAKWVHKLKPFPLGDPMARMKLLPVGNGLDIERAITPQERRRILDAADRLLRTGGESKDRNRYRNSERPKRKGFRPYRNRAIVYALIETGMRRAAVAALNLVDVDFRRKLVSVTEKGGSVHRYPISTEGLEVIRDYIELERPQDGADAPALFLSAAVNANGKGRLSTVAINDVWNQVCDAAGVEGRTPHSARHAMGRHIIEKTGNVAAVQRQLGHRNAAYLMQYARITQAELNEVLDDR